MDDLRIDEFGEESLENYNQDNYDQFNSAMFDYVSALVLPDEAFEENLDFLQELTYEMYKIYDKSSMVLPNGSSVKYMSPKTCGKMLELFISLSNRFGKF